MSQTDSEHQQREGSEDEQEDETAPSETPPVPTYNTPTAGESLHLSLCGWWCRKSSLRKSHLVISAKKMLMTSTLTFTLGVRCFYFAAPAAMWVHPFFPVLLNGSNMSCVSSFSSPGRLLVPGGSWDPPPLCFASAACSTLSCDFIISEIRDRFEIQIRFTILSWEMFGKVRKISEGSFSSDLAYKESVSFLYLLFFFCLFQQLQNRPSLTNGHGRTVTATKEKGRRWGEGQEQDQSRRAGGGKEADTAHLRRRLQPRQVGRGTFLPSYNFIYIIFWLFPFKED